MYGHKGAGSASTCMHMIVMLGSSSRSTCRLPKRELPYVRPTAIKTPYHPSTITQSRKKPITVFGTHSGCGLDAWYPVTHTALTYCPPPTHCPDDPRRQSGSQSLPPPHPFHTPAPACAASCTHSGQPTAPTCTNFAPLHTAACPAACAPRDPTQATTQGTGYTGAPLGSARSIVAGYRTPLPPPPRGPVPETRLPRHAAPAEAGGAGAGGAGRAAPGVGQDARA